MLRKLQKISKNRNDWRNMKKCNNKRRKVIKSYECSKSKWHNNRDRKNWKKRGKSFKILGKANTGVRNLISLRDITQQRFYYQHLRIENKKYRKEEICLNLSLQMKYKSTHIAMINLLKKRIKSANKDKTNENLKSLKMRIIIE